jgi:hypothetical protein
VEGSIEPSRCRWSSALGRERINDMGEPEFNQRSQKLEVKLKK